MLSLLSKNPVCIIIGYHENICWIAMQIFYQYKTLYVLAEVLIYSV